MCELGENGALSSDWADQLGSRVNKPISEGRLGNGS